ncbi:hypothetical protein O3M35_002298 [Rhynocoris fuscipes]|uniref:Dynein light chain n=1 Tax=Rhynocoris fuscipes TaxID=488301 RepID=A0AAW1CMB5_9HEMI
MKYKLYNTFKGKQYQDIDNHGKVIRTLANDIRKEIEGVFNERFKYVVQVILGEHKLAGVQSIFRAIWDPNCDNYMSEKFENDSIFCLITIFGTYMY